MKRILVIFAFILAGAAWVSAQDLPDLPPLDTSAAPPTAGGLPDLPPIDNAPAVAIPASEANAEKPVLLGAEKKDKKEKKEKKAKEDKEGKIVIQGSDEGMPALPGEEKVAPKEEKAASGEGKTETLTTLPGETSALKTDEAATTPASGKTAKKPASKKKPHGPAPNTIFGGWVSPKGKSEVLQLAWSSQEVLNAMIGSKYQLLKEEGKYSSKGWREFTFEHSKTKRQVQVYVRQQGKKVWMRVGPPEPPAGVPYQESVQVRRDSHTALKILQKKFGKRLTPKKGSWEAPYDRPKS